jgi:hypothetical protein
MAARHTLKEPRRAKPGASQVLAPSTARLHDRRLYRSRMGVNPTAANRSLGQYPEPIRLGWKTVLSGNAPDSHGPRTNPKEGER